MPTTQGPTSSDSEEQTGGDPSPKNLFWSALEKLGAFIWEKPIWLWPLLALMVMQPTWFLPLFPAIYMSGIGLGALFEGRKFMKDDCIPLAMILVSLALPLAALVCPPGNWSAYLLLGSTLPLLLLSSSYIVHQTSTKRWPSFNIQLTSVGATSAVVYVYVAWPYFMRDATYPYYSKMEGALRWISQW